jgi:hydroxymethylpyrimidine/phosphomethylpyrimidine kinase
MHNAPLTAPPVVLVFAGHDPTGGAGIQADIEAIAAHGCHAATLVTALTAQGTRTVREIFPQATAALRVQATTLLLDLDLPVAAVKIGLLGSLDIVLVVAKILRGLHPRPPVVLDPVLAAGGGHPFADLAIIEAICHHLLPLTTLVTPNVGEVQSLAPCLLLGAAGGDADAAAAGITDAAAAGITDAAAARVLNAGAGAVLVTGADLPTDLVEHRLYRSSLAPLISHWPRLSGSYHGSGCTLASACAARLARGEELLTAVRGAEAYTHRTLAQAYRVGGGPLNPRRLLRGEGGGDGKAPSPWPSPEGRGDE